MRIGGVILCGGKSSRMGQSKAMLPFGDELMLQRIVRILSGEVSPIVVVAAHGQQLPELPVDTIVVRDEQPDAGPLQGIATGLSAISEFADAAYVTSCDVPLIAPAFVRHMIQSLEDHEIAIPRDEKYFHPLAAVYRTSVARQAYSLLKQEKRRPVYLLEQCRTHEVTVEQLRAVDAQLLSLMNLNRPEDYRSALQIAGLCD